MRHFCTLFDSNYLLKGVAMLRSLRAHCPDAEVHVLCLDELAQQLLERLALPGVHCLPLAEVEDEALLAVKPGRKRAEYCWTLSPCLPWYLLHQRPDIDFITYLDADLYFYSDLQPLFDEIGDSSIVIIEHRYVPGLEHLLVRGRFCVEWVSFRRDAEGLACLARWREQCIEWCFYELQEDRMGDQKYLDEWPERYRQLCILEHPGAGVAPWNYARYRYGRDASSRLTVDGAPLIFYHFHQFQLLSNGGFDRMSNYYTRTGPVPAALYDVYEDDLRRLQQEIGRLSPGFAGGVQPWFRVKSQRLMQALAPEWIKEALKRVIRAV